MAERFLTRSAVMLILTRTEGNRKEILLQKRQNTGYADGMWDCAASGHVEQGESMKMTVIREAREELGIRIHMDDVYFATLTHKHTVETGNTYYNAFFVVEKYDGVPEIMEIDKCAEIKWFSMDALPTDLIPDRIEGIRNCESGIHYSEYGWKYTIK